MEVDSETAKTDKNLQDDIGGTLNNSISNEEVQITGTTDTTLDNVSAPDSGDHDLVDVSPLETSGDMEDKLEDEDRDFLKDDFMENLAVVDSCYSDPEDNASLNEQSLVDNDVVPNIIRKEKNMEEKYKSSRDIQDHRRLGVENYQSRGQAENARASRCDKDYIASRSRNPIISYKPRSSRERDKGYRRSRERHLERPIHYPDRLSRKYYRERREGSSERRLYDRRDRREPIIPPKEEKKTADTVPVIKPVNIEQIDTLVPPGTEDILLPDDSAKTSEVNNVTSSKEIKVENVQKAEKRKRVSDEMDGLGKKRKSFSPALPELMTRDRVKRDQERISRELSRERIRQISRNRAIESSRDRIHERNRHRERNMREASLEMVQRLRNERFNRELSRERARRMSNSSSYRYSRTRRHASRDKGNGRNLALSPVSIGRMSRSSRLSFELSPVSSHDLSRVAEYRNRSFSPISSGGSLSRSRSMISISPEENSRSRRRKRSPFWKEMERKLGITMMDPINQNYHSPMLQHENPQYQTELYIDMTAPPPNNYQLLPPPMGISYPPPAYFTPPLETLPSPVANYQGPSVIVNERAKTVMKPQRTLTQVVQTPTFHFSRPKLMPGELPEAPPPPQISGNSVKPSMSLTSFLEAAVRGTNTTTSLDTEPSAGVKNLDAAIVALREDNVFNMIMSGRLVVEQPSNLLQYTVKQRFNHPAQESMIKLKSPLLRTSVVQLDFTRLPPQPFKPSIETPDQDTDNEISIIAEVAKSSNNVIAMLDLIDDAEFSDREEEKVSCAKCQVRSRVVMVNASTQCGPVEVRSVQTQSVSFVESLPKTPNENSEGSWAQQVGLQKYSEANSDVLKNFSFTRAPSFANANLNLNNPSDKTFYQPSITRSHDMNPMLIRPKHPDISLKASGFTPMKNNVEKESYVSKYTTSFSQPQTRIVENVSQKDNRNIESTNLASSLVGKSNTSFGSSSNHLAVFHSQGKDLGSQDKEQLNRTTANRQFNVNPLFQTPNVLADAKLGFTGGNKSSTTFNQQSQFDGSPYQTQPFKLQPNQKEPLFGATNQKSTSTSISQFNQNKWYDNSAQIPPFKSQTSQKATTFNIQANQKSTVTGVPFNPKQFEASNQTPMYKGDLKEATFVGQDTQKDTFDRQSRPIQPFTANQKGTFGNSQSAFSGGQLNRTPANINNSKTFPGTYVGSQANQQGLWWSPQSNPSIPWLTDNSRTFNRPGALPNLPAGFSRDQYQPQYDNQAQKKY